MEVDTNDYNLIATASPSTTSGNDSTNVLQQQQPSSFHHQQQQQQYSSQHVFSFNQQPQQQQLLFQPTIFSPLQQQTNNQYQQQSSIFQSSQTSPAGKVSIPPLSVPENVEKVFSNAVVTLLNGLENVIMDENIRSASQNIISNSLSISSPMIKRISSDKISLRTPSVEQLGMMLIDGAMAHVPTSAPHHQNHNNSGAASPVTQLYASAQSPTPSMQRASSFGADSSLPVGGSDQFTSPSKRKRDSSHLQLPDAKSQKISSFLSQRLVKSLRVADDSEDVDSLTVNGGGEKRAFGDEGDNEDETMGVDSVHTSNGSMAATTATNISMDLSFSTMDLMTLNEQGAVGQLAGPFPQHHQQQQQLRRHLKNLSVNVRKRLNNTKSMSDIADAGADNGEKLDSRASTPSVLSPFSSSSSLFSDIQPSNISSWMEKQAQKKQMSLGEYTMQWEIKRKELEHNLALLQSGLQSSFNQTPVESNSPSQQSSACYDDLKSLILKVSEAAQVLSGGCTKELGELVPLWKDLEKSLDILEQYVIVNEDMIATLQTPTHPTNDIPTDLKRYRDLLQSKKELWGKDILSSNGLYWKAIGLPVNEELICNIRNWVYGLGMMIMMATQQEIASNSAKHDIGMGFSVDSSLSSPTNGSFMAPKMRTNYFMDIILNALIYASECAEFVRLPLPSRFMDATFTLATQYMSFGLSLLDVSASAISPSGRRSQHYHHHNQFRGWHAKTLSAKIPETKLLQLVENVTKVLTILRIIRDGQEVAKQPPITISQPESSFRSRAKSKSPTNLTPSVGINVEKDTTSAHSTKLAVPVVKIAGLLSSPVAEQFSMMVIKVGLFFLEQISLRSKKTSVGLGQNVAGLKTPNGSSGTIASSRHLGIIIVMVWKFFNKLFQVIGGGNGGEEGRLHALMSHLPVELQTQITFV